MNTNSTLESHRMHNPKYKSKVFHMRLGPPNISGAKELVIGVDSMREKLGLEMPFPGDTGMYIRTVTAHLAVSN